MGGDENGHFLATGVRTLLSVGLLVLSHRADCQVGRKNNTIVSLARFVIPISRCFYVLSSLCNGSKNATFHIQLDLLTVMYLQGTPLE